MHACVFVCVCARVCLFVCVRVCVCLSIYFVDVHMTYICMYMSTSVRYVYLRTLTNNARALCAFSDAGASL